MKSSAPKIYYQDSGYNIDRNLLDVPLKKYASTKKIGLSKLLSYTHYQIKGVNSFLDNTHWEFFKKKDGVWHFFNSVSFGKTPWVVTFETCIPRWKINEEYWGINSKKIVEQGVKAIASDSCKKLIAISDCTKQFQNCYLQRNYPSYAESIAEKIVVLHPPQKPLLQRYKDKDLSNSIYTFTIIGADFFRKGGKEILIAFDRLLQQDAPLRLNIISTLHYGDYASKATSHDLREAKSIIDKYPDRIVHHNRLPNKQVLLLLKNSHVGLLPTYGDTYGYSVLEAQASGCPVITTNLRALPEINNDECGWVIKVPKNKWGNGKLSTEAERENFSHILREQLYQIIDDIIADPHQIAEKGRLSLQRIKDEHSPECVARRLEEIYDEALGV